MLALSQYLARAWNTVITPATLISRSQRRKRQLWTVCVLFALWGSFILDCETHQPASPTAEPGAIASEAVIQQVPLHRKCCAEAVVSVHSFLKQFCSKLKQPWQQARLKGMLKLQHQCLWATLTTQQKLVILTASFINGIPSVLHLAITTTVFVVSMHQLVWSALPALSITRIFFMPGELFFIPMADAAWVSYVSQILMTPGWHADQIAIAIAAATQLTPSISWSIMLVVAMWTIRNLLLAEAALDKLNAEDREAVQLISVNITGTPWVIPVHRMVPPAGLIAMLLIIAGIEVNPGPAFQAILTWLLLMTTAGRKRPWYSVPEGTATCFPFMRSKPCT